MHGYLVANPVKSVALAPCVALVSLWRRPRTTWKVSFHAHLGILGDPLARKQVLVCPSLRKFLRREELLAFVQVRMIL